MELERKTLLVQFIAVAPLTFYATSDGTDLVQDILRSQLARQEKDIFGQEGSLSIDDQGEFLTFEPSDTNNRTLHLPIEHLAYSGALRRMRHDSSDQRNPDQIPQRDFENVDLANRYAHRIIGPPIFVAVFHGFDNALCYTFITQNADDACLLVMKLMRAFRQYEQQQIEQQGQINQGSSSSSSSPHIIHPHESIPSSVGVAHPSLSLHHSSQPFIVDNNPLFVQPTYHLSSNMYNQNICHDDFLERLLSNPNVQVVNQPCAPILSAPSSTVCYSTVNPAPTIVVRTRDNCCIPPLSSSSSSSCSLVPQDTFVCTQCCLPVASTTCILEDSSLAGTSFCYSP